ncbi:MAG: hypothetical protein H5U28_01000 [Burkholderiaceae bacterium]|nr:hypothetical protein [Burkholderiaceae bacterium]
MKIISDFIQQVAKQFQGKWHTVTIDELEASDGRSSNPNPACTNGSFIYVAYENDHVLYVGESSKSVKRRFIVDGSGSHKQKNKNWYDRVTKIHYLKMGHDDLPDRQRKLLEQAFSIHFNPEFYG